MDVGLPKAPLLQTKVSTQYNYHTVCAPLGFFAMGCVEYDHVIQKFSPATPYPSFSHPMRLATGQSVILIPGEVVKAKPMDCLTWGRQFDGLRLLAIFVLDFAVDLRDGSRLMVFP
jgi:hypothetical protein